MKFLLLLTFLLSVFSVFIEAYDKNQEFACIEINKAHLLVAEAIGALNRVELVLEDEGDSKKIHDAYLDVWDSSRPLVKIFHEYECWRYL